ncbi:MAG: nucleotidyltransferase [Bacteroidota bacterium]
MDILDEDLIQFWTILNKHSVQYIMVGGFAVNLYGYTRATNDIDLLLNDDALNRQNLAKAFSELGYGDISFEQLQFVPGWTNFYIGTGVQLDIMTSLKGVDLSFDECLKMAPVAEIEGVMVPFLHINHLIQNKKIVNRPKDQIDVMELEKIKKILAERQA